MLIPLSARKIVRDLIAMRGRVAMMIGAIAVSVAAVGAVLGSRAILEREIRVNYISTNPASATLHVPGGAKADALRIARSRPGVLDAALRTRSGARMVLANGRRVPLLLFVAPASDPMRIAGFRVERGHWPAAGDELLLERSSLAYFGLHAGERIALETSGARTWTVRIAGAVHDGAVSPSSQEGIAYGYATPALLSRLGKAPGLDELKIVAGDANGAFTNVRRIDAVAQDVGTALRARGVAVTRIDAPPPLRHPHQAQMETATGLLMTFAVLTLLLGAILIATMLGSMLTQQIRQIGVMKALGAGDGTVFGMYALMAAAIAVAATAVALVPSVLAARYLAAVVAGLFGIDLTSLDVPWSVFAVEIAAGVLVPVAVAYAPLARGTSITVREAIDGTARSGAAFGTLRLQSLLGRWNTGNRTLRLALRNVVRHPGRLALVVMLLGASGAMFVSAIGTANGMQAVVDEGMSHRRYDVAVNLSRAEDAASVIRTMNAVPDVQAFETGITASATIPHDGAIDVTRTYPDGGHGSFTMTAVRPDTAFVQLPLTQGRWLRGDDANAVVFNHLVIPQQAHDARVGELVAIALNGRVARYRLVGTVSDFGNPATAYVTESGFARASGEPGRVSQIRVVTRGHDGAARAAAVAAIQRRFADEGIVLRSATPVGQFRLALNGHALVLAQTLGAIAVVMAIVGIFGLGSAIGSGVLERTREFGIMRSIGASSRAVAAIVVVEGLLYGALSAVAALLLSIPLTLMLDRFIGMQAFLVPLPFVLPPAVVAISTAVGFAAAALASLAGALAAARLTIRDALAAV
ncbi:MAG: FtsX-like permease family protein [Candidatus Eremiobacteraeota bacterium]|nr:FtsX-like permease family protein [Candidatus Eremiobacteraeota bacterium]